MIHPSEETHNHIIVAQPFDTHGRFRIGQHPFHAAQRLTSHNFHKFQVFRNTDAHLEIETPQGIAGEVDDNALISYGIGNSEMIPLESHQDHFPGAQTNHLPFIPIYLYKIVH